jgi:uncharacterized protein YjbJ (UPF0337 family)
MKRKVSDLPKAKSKQAKGREVAGQAAKVEDPHNVAPSDTIVRIKTPQQQPQGMPTAGEIKGKWQQQIGAAKIMWGKLSEDELLKAEGHEQKLTGLIKERYAISHAEAEKQVREFMKKTKL